MQATTTNPTVNVQFSHLRAYVAGTGATGALIGGAAVVFLSLAAFVAFSGSLPFGGSAGNGSAYVGSDSRAVSSDSAGAPATAGAALGAATRAVAAQPASRALRGQAGPHRGSAATAGGDSNGAEPGGPTGPPPAGGGSGSPGSAGPLTNTVGTLDQVTGQHLSGTTGGVTHQIDRTATDALNGAGGAGGHPHLGQGVGNAVNRLTDGAGGLPGLGH